jgi:SAM-dependent methyltransferase
VWEIPDTRLDVLGDVRGRDVLEYGCGGGQWSIALARRGAKAVGLDVSIGQLSHAQRLQEMAVVAFPVVNADAERAPFADASFDIVFCDHGAMTFTDPHRTVPEAARLLRPGGLFVFNIASPLIWLCWGDGEEPPGSELVRDYFGMRRGAWGDSVEFQLPYGEWIRLFRSNGFAVLDLIELRPPARPRTTYPDFAPVEWARRWPGENIWKLQKVS